MEKLIGARRGEVMVAKRGTMLERGEVSLTDAMREAAKGYPGEPPVNHEFIGIDPAGEVQGLLDQAAHYGDKGDHKLSSWFRQSAKNLQKEAAA